VKIEVTTDAGDRHIVDVKRWSFGTLSRAGECCPGEKTGPSTLDKLCLADMGQGTPFSYVPTGPMGFAMGADIFSFICCTCSAMMPRERGVSHEGSDGVPRGEAC
jgi:hypothetical protein